MTNPRQVPGPDELDRVFLDTNVLLASTDRGRADHTASLVILNDWAVAGVELYTSGQVLREYLVVATRPMVSNGLGLAPRDALANVAAFRTRITSLDATGAVHAKLAQLVRDFECQGKQIHDTNLVATMLVHGVESIVTGNTGDFSRFAPAVQVLDLSEYG